MHANLAQTQAMQLRVNSFFLPAQCDKKFDLVWIDGGHMYPEIAWDACNAFHLCKDGGMLVFDDVVLHAKPSNRRYLSQGMVTILEYIARRSPCRVTFLMKYVHPYSSGLPVNEGILQLLRKRRQNQATADKRVVYGSLAIIDNFDRSREISFSHQETGLVSTYLARAVDGCRSKIWSRSVV